MLPRPLGILTNQESTTMPDTTPNPTTKPKTTITIEIDEELEALAVSAGMTTEELLQKAWKRLLESTRCPND
jgi:hypothetical protein